jgi:hypothetical protein
MRIEASSRIVALPMKQFSLAVRSGGFEAQPTQAAKIMRTVKVALVI